RRRGRLLDDARDPPIAVELGHAEALQVVQVGHLTEDDSRALLLLDERIYAAPDGAAEDVVREQHDHALAADESLRQAQRLRVAASVGPVRWGRTEFENAMNSVKRVSGLLGLAAFALPALACNPVTRSNEEVYQPPPSLALVAIVDPSQGRLPAQLRQLQDVIKSGATPNEAIVVMLLEPSF